LLPREILDRRSVDRCAHGRVAQRDLKPCSGRCRARRWSGGLFRYELIAALIADHEANRIDGTDRLPSLLNSRSGPIYLTAGMPAMGGRVAGGSVKILPLPPFSVSPKRGGKIRPFNMIQHSRASTRSRLARLSIRMSRRRRAQASPTTAHTTRWRASGMRSTGRMVARLPTPVPSSFGFFHSPDLARWVRERSRERFNDLRALPSVAPYVAAVHNVPKILDFGDMDSQKWLEYSRYKPFPLSLGYALEGHKLAHEERRLAQKFDVHRDDAWGGRVVSDRHADRLVSERRGRGYFSPTDEPYDPTRSRSSAGWIIIRTSACSTSADGRRCPDEATGAQAFHRRRRPISSCMTTRRSARRHGDWLSPRCPSVSSALGVDGCSANIARGTQNKILESMAMGVPVITSRFAAAGVDAIDGTHFLVGSSMDDYAQAIERVIDDPALRRRLSIAGRERWLTHHDWERSMQRLDSIVERCLSQRGAVSQPVSGCNNNSELT
jgi:hypothetical protein